MIIYTIQTELKIIDDITDSENFLFARSMLRMFGG